MQRYGRVLKLKDGAEAEYDRLHAEVWPEVLDAIRRSGIRNYSIFRYRTWLFSYFELPAGQSPDSIGQVFDDNPACARWEQTMQALQAPLPESGAGAWWVPMNAVFYFNRGG